MSFCQNCGTQQLGATSFCTSCGTRLARVEDPVEQPAPALAGPAPQPRQAMNWSGQPSPVASEAPVAPNVAPVIPSGLPVQRGAWHPGAPPSPPSATTNAVAGGSTIPSVYQLWQRYGGDWSRAVISILILMLSLSMDWNRLGSSADNVPALLAIIVALPIGVVDLLLRPAVVGRVFDANQRLLFRALLAAPLVAVALWALIDNLIHGSGFGAGIGVALTGAAIGITGAVTMSEPGQARMCKHVTRIEDGAFIGSNTSLVAPVMIGENANIGAGSVIVVDAPAEKLSVARARQTIIEDWQRPRKKD